MSLLQKNELDKSEDNSYEPLTHEEFVLNEKTIKQFLGTLIISGELEKLLILFY